MRRPPGLRFLGLCLLGPPLAAVLAFAALNAVFPFPEDRLAAPWSTRVLDRNGAELRRFLAQDGMWRFPVGLDEVAPELVTALVESEDRWFYRHPGVNPLSIVRAAWGNLAAGRVVSGASTIPMQIARMADPRPRTLGAKLIEAFRAVQLELAHTKEELLAIYLNMAPFGGNITGVGAASRLYFGKPPDRLSLGECAFLAVLPRAPTKYDPVKNPRAAMQVRNRVLAMLAGRGAVSPELARRAMRQPMVAHRRSSPMLAPHFTLMAKNRLGAEPVLATSLDLPRQRILEGLVRRHAARIRQQGVANVAAVALDRRTREVLALAGSADFGDDRFQGQVNNALARRSPGSALKPFLYAQAFDKGLAVAQSYLLDVPADYSGYAPENYTGVFHGRVTAAEALARSLNAPAVRLLADVGLESFHGLLKRGGLESIDRPASAYGLPLALGACEVRLVDLTNLYATLGEGGMHWPWRITAGEPGPGTRLFSPEAAHVVAEILGGVTRPDMPDSWRLTLDRPAAAWKTGTSFGHRDAWAVGFGADVAVGVWVGNPDGTPVQGISGANHAGPLFFDILRALAPASRDLNLPDAPGLRQVRLCAHSHQLAGPDCPETITATAGPNLALARCAEHRRVMVDAETGLRLEGGCLLTRPAAARVFAATPPELASWLTAQGKPVPALPELSPACADVPRGRGPTIVSPSPGTPYVMRHDAPREFQQIALAASSSEPGGPLWWYVDGRFAGTSAPERKLFLPMTPGPHTASVTDAQGRTSSVAFRVVR